MSNQHLSVINPPAMTNPAALFIWCQIEGFTWPITLAVGSNWLVATAPGTYFINADEPVTHDEVQALLIEAGGITELHSSY